MTLPTFPTVTRNTRFPSLFPHLLFFVDMADYNFFNFFIIITFTRCSHRIFLFRLCFLTVIF